MKQSRYKLFFLGLALLVFCPAFSQTPIYLDESKPLEQRVEDALSRMTLREKIAVLHAQSKFSAAGVKRLGFPDFWTDDGPHGVRPDVLWDEWNQAGQTNDSCIAFPALTCLAASWNPEVARIYGKSLGEEALYRHKNMILGPGVNIYRTPLNGRNFEYMGEDPYLTSTMVVPYVQGLQSCGVSACIKHYALNNNEQNRHTTNVTVSDRALHEIYLPGFKAAVQQGGAWAVMGAYNLYKDQHNCHNQYLLMDILKGDWKFDGVVVSDWGGTHDTNQAVHNGLDMEFGTGTDGLSKNMNAYDSYYLAYPYLQGISAGKYGQDELNDKVRRVLRLYFRTSMNRQRPYGFLCSDAHYEAARQIAHEGIVLLQNNGQLLPIDLQKMHKILVVGENAIKMMTVGGGSSSLKAQHEVLPLTAIKEIAKGKATIDFARGYVGDVGGKQDGLSTGQDLNDKRPAEELIAEAAQKAREADVVILFGGLNKANYQDCEGNDRQSYDLPYSQNQLVEALVKANQNIVFVSISGNAAALPWASKVPSIVQAWYLGSEAGTAIADVLFGKVNPSGKLPFTWGQRLEDYGAHAIAGAYPGTKRANSDIVDEEYKEGIFVGYRWTDKEKVKPLFAFGHGLSYTTFQLGKATANKKLLQKDQTISFRVAVKNTGNRAGAEVVQLYISDLKSLLPRPVKELKAFQKVFLQPGESREVVLTIGSEALSYYDESIHDWTCEPGDFEALIGTASDQISSRVKFTLN